MTDSGAAAAAPYFNAMPSVDISWTITAALLVYFMHGGFGFYEAGMCRIKNTVDTLSHNVLILAVTLLVYWAVGFGLMFGRGNGFMGTMGWAPRLLGPVHSWPALASYGLPLAVSFAFAMSFADTPATLIAGSGAERIRFSAVMLLTVVISGGLFPIVGHWIVGGGWLSRLAIPVYDTGSGMVHLTGGCCALAVSLLLGPRREYRRKSTRQWNRKEQVSSMPLVFLGAFILWLGFFGFNAGFAMRVSGSVGLVVANTALAGAAGAVAAMAGVKWRTGKARLRTTIVGLLTANVAVTSPSAIVEPWAAVAIGAIAGILTVICIPFFSRLRLDDPTEYLTMNLVGGLTGLISVGLFASPAILSRYSVRPLPHAGLFYGGGLSQLASELIAAIAIIAFALGIMLTACFALRSKDLLRVQAVEEQQGEDRSTHGEQAYEKP